MLPRVVQRVSPYDNFRASCFPEVHVKLTPMTDNPYSTSPVSARTPAHDEKPHANNQADASNAPLISVCMPVYNAKRYLGEAIESILGQTFRDFEFLIIDDGSTDRSLRNPRALCGSRRAHPTIEQA